MKDRIPVEYNLMIAFVEDRIKANEDNEEIKRRLNLLITDVKALAEIDLEEHDARRHFVDDYE
jgi:hypothetical protein